MSAIPNEVIDAEVVDSDIIVLEKISYPVSQSYLDDIVSKYSDIPEIDPDADSDLVASQFDFVLKGHKELVKARNSIEKTRKKLKAPALEYGKEVDSIAKEFQLVIKPIEDKLFIQRKVVEDNEARKQREAEEAEELRVSEIKTRILNVKNLPLQHFNSSVSDITKALESLVAISTDVYDEFYDEAVENQNFVIAQLQTARDNKILVENAQKIKDEEDARARKIQEEEDKKLQDERDLFDEQRADFEKQKAAFDAMQREQQEILDRIEAERVADELQAKQEAQKQEEANINAEKHDTMVKETMAVLNTYSEMIILIDDIIDGKIPHVKWVLDE